jgi:hypothetical protein
MLDLKKHSCIALRTPVVENVNCTVELPFGWILQHKRPSLLDVARRRALVVRAGDRGTVGQNT